MAVADAGRQELARSQARHVARSIAFALGLGAVTVTLTPFGARAEPQVLTASQMEGVTAAGFVHLDLPEIRVIVLNPPDVNVLVNVDLGDVVIRDNNIAQVAIATTVGVAVCGVCIGGSPQVTGTTIALNNLSMLQSLR